VSTRPGPRARRRWREKKRLGKKGVVSLYTDVVRWIGSSEFPRCTAQVNDRDELVILGPNGSEFDRCPAGTWKRAVTRCDGDVVAEYQARTPLIRVLSSDELLKELLTP
jgi:hypothetical protein